MRSNDVFIGLPHDVFCFTMIQELVARSVEADVGQYVHVVGSLHLYDDKAQAARRFLQEGYHTTKAMPPMPAIDPMDSVAELLECEERLRSGSDPFSVALPSNPYWADLARLLMVRVLDRAGRGGEIPSVMNQMTTDVYNVHVEDRLDRNGRNQ
jgi:thymidylate synthase